MPQLWRSHYCPCIKAQWLLFFARTVSAGVFSGRQRVHKVRHRAPGFLGSYHCLSFIFIPPPAFLLAVGDFFFFPPCCLAALQTTFYKNLPAASSWDFLQQSISEAKSSPCALDNTYTGGGGGVFWGREQTAGCAALPRAQSPA